MSPWEALAYVGILGIMVAGAFFGGVFLCFKAKFWGMRFQAEGSAYERKMAHEGTHSADELARLRAYAASQEGYEGSHPAGEPIPMPGERTLKEDPWERQASQA